MHAYMSVVGHTETTHVVLEHTKMPNIFVCTCLACVSDVGLACISDFGGFRIDCDISHSLV